MLVLSDIVFYFVGIMFTVLWGEVHNPVTGGDLEVPQ